MAFIDSLFGRRSFLQLCDRMHSMPRTNLKKKTFTMDIFLRFVHPKFLRCTFGRNLVLSKFLKRFFLKKQCMLLNFVYERMLFVNAEMLFCHRLNIACIGTHKNYHVKCCVESKHD